MRARIVNPDSLFSGEEGKVVRRFEETPLAGPALLIALDTRGFGEHRLGLSFRESEVELLGDEVAAHRSSLEGGA